MRPSASSSRWRCPTCSRPIVAMVGYGYAGVLLRATACAVVLTPPTMLMGATLPAISRWFDQPRRGGVISRLPLHREHRRRRRRHGARGVLPAPRLRHGRRGCGGGGDQHRRRSSVPGGWPIAATATARQPRGSGSPDQRSMDLSSRWSHRCRVRSLAADLRRRCDVGIHRAWRRGGVDAPAVAALRRQRLHVLADPRRVPRRARRGQPGRLVAGAALERPGRALSGERSCCSPLRSPSAPG